MKIEAGKDYIARQGQKYHVVATDCPREGFPVLGWFASGKLAQYTSNGRYFDNGDLSTLDLVAAWSDLPSEVFVNVYSGRGLGGVYPSAKKAEAAAIGPDLIATAVRYVLAGN